MDAVLTKHNVIVALHVLVSAAGIVWLTCQWIAARSPDPRSVSGYVWDGLRWAALVAFLGLWAIVTVRSAHGVPFRVPSMTLFMTAVVIATLQWFNVWFVAWPAVSLGPAGADLRRTESVLRANATTAVPMVFFFAAASWATELGGSGRWIPSKYWLVTGALYFGLEILALVLPGAVRAALRTAVVWIALGAAMPFALRSI